MGFIGGVSAPELTSLATGPMVHKPTRNLRGDG